MLHRRKLHYQPPPLCKGAHEGRAQCAKQAVAVEGPEYRTSEAQAGTKTPVKQGASQVHGANPEARRAGGARTRPKGVRSAGTPGRYEGGRRPTRPRQFGAEGREVAGVSSTRSEAESAGATPQSASLTAPLTQGSLWAAVRRGRCEPGGREAAGAPRTRSEAESAGAEHRASVSAGAHEGRAQCAKQAEVSPMKQGVPQASL